MLVSCVVFTSVYDTDPVTRKITMPDSYSLCSDDCPYKKAAADDDGNFNKSARAPLHMEGNSSQTLLILQAPGLDEWEARKPLWSENPHSASARIRNSLRRIGLARTDFSITNSTQCYPGKGKLSRDKPPLASARRCCSYWLKQDITSAEFSRIVVFGTLAEKSVYELGFRGDKRFTFIGHPSGRLSNIELDAALKPS